MRMNKAVAIAVALVATVSTSQAALSGNITISGTVGNNTAITVTPVAPYNDLAIEAGETGTKWSFINNIYT